MRLQIEHDLRLCAFSIIYNELRYFVSEWNGVEGQRVPDWNTLFSFPVRRSKIFHSEA